MPAIVKYHNLGHAGVDIRLQCGKMLRRVGPINIIIAFCSLQYNRLGYLAYFHAATVCQYRATFCLFNSLLHIFNL